MLRQIFLILLSLLLFYSCGVYVALAQELLPLAPPRLLYGTIEVDGTPLTQNDTGYTVSVKMDLLLVIFLHSSDSQGFITSIINGLGSTPSDTVPLRQAFEDPVIGYYCINYGLLLSANAIVTVEVAGSQWRVADSGRMYTVKAENISTGKKLEVYLHDGVITSYPMGSDPSVGNYYVVQIPMNPVNMLSSDGTYGLREPGTAVPNEGAYMHVNDVFISAPGFTIGDQDVLVEMNVSGTSTYKFTIDLEDGFNFFSFPIEPLNTDIAILLADLNGKYESVKSYDNTSKDWLVYTPLMLVPTLNEIRAGAGYFIKMTQSGQSLTVEGVPPMTTAIILKSGNNLVGYNSLNTRNIEQVMSFISGQYESVKSYDNTNKNWLVYTPIMLVPTLTSMVAGGAYWIMNVSGDNVPWDVEQ